MGKYLIYNKERSDADGMAYWWRPNKAGYTVHIEEAGRYTQEEARKIVADARGGDLMIAAEDVTDGDLTTYTVVDTAVDGNGAAIKEFGRLAWEAAND